MFDQIIGNEEIKNFLRTMVKKKTVGNSLLFAGPAGIGKSLLAMELAAAIITEQKEDSPHYHKIKAGTHPDLHQLHPEGKTGMHSIESMRKFSEDVYMAPFEANRKVFIIHDAERMLSYSANALLKTFEEPAADTVIILITGNPEQLLGTVISRCRKIFFKDLTEEERALLPQKPEESENAISLLEPLFKQGKFQTYAQLSGFVKGIGEQMDSRKKQWEEALRKELYGNFHDLSAYQKQALEKEIEGAIALSALREARLLLNDLHAWFRDLHIYRLGVDAKYIIHKTRKQELEEFAKKAAIPDPDTIQKAIKDTYTSLERSTSLAICLETLLLKLNLL